MKTVIGITGAIGSGKDTVADYIGRTLHIPVFQVSAPIKDEVKKRGLPLTRLNVMNMGYELAKEFGEEYLAKKHLENIETIGVISGFRQLQQLDYLKEHSRLILIAVESDPQLRFNRVHARNSLEELPTLEAFLEHENHENTDPVSPMRLFECMKRADYVIENDSDLQTLFKKTDEVLEKEGFLSQN